MSAGAPGRPMSRDSCGTEICDGDGISIHLKPEDVDAILWLPPHGVIAIDPRRKLHLNT